MWRAKGYSGAGNVEPLIGALEGRTAVVCGNAVGVFEDYDKASLEDHNGSVCDSRGSRG